MTNPTLTLYIGNGCPFCRRVLDYLDQHPMPVKIIDVWSDDKALAELKQLAHGRTQVPCLKIDADYMHESLDIIEKLKALKVS